MSYIRTYGNVITKQFCKDVIEKFESNTDHHIPTYLEGHRSFTEINLNQYTDVWQPEIDTFMTSLHTCLFRYKADSGIDDKSWPEQMGYEEFRMKRYLPNDEDQIKFHVDVQDYASARRFLVYFWYLNDVEDGGETAFQMNRNVLPQIKVKPKAGTLLIFPCLWTHPHVALPPISGSKYIIGGYLHYV
jgi:prolyl 4-hydroxylase